MKKIMIAEGLNDTGDVMSQMFKRMFGLDTVPAGSLAEIREHLSKGNVGWIFLDNQFVDGNTTAGLIQEVLEHHPDIILIATSGGNDYHDQRSQGCHHGLQKTIHTKDLQGLLQVLKLIQN